jgi:hypothetical protein
MWVAFMNEVIAYLSFSLPPLLGPILPQRLISSRSISIFRFEKP